MNPLSAIFDLVANVFMTAKRASGEQEQQGPKGQAYEQWLSRYGYEAQFHAWMKAHGTPEGFVYTDPGEMPEGWMP